jgi:hypothetical protein
MEQMTQIDRLGGVLIYAIVALFNAAGHWFPWPVWPGVTNERGQLQRVLAYCYGVGSIVGGVILRCVLWLLMDVISVAVERVIGVVLLTVVAAALGTLVPYAVDEILEHKALVKDVEDYESSIEG